MESIEEFLVIFVRVLFIIVIPAVALFFRLRGKIQTGFTLGLILLSFLLGILISGSIHEDPVKVFTRTINSGDVEKSKIALKRVIQLEEDAFARIDRTKIARPDLYTKLTSELIHEYRDIAIRHYDTYRTLPEARCENIEAYETAVNNLGHALRVSRYAKMLGGGDPALHNSIMISLSDAVKKLKGLKEKCKDAKP